MGKIETGERSKYHSTKHSSTDQEKRTYHRYTNLNYSQLSGCLSTLSMTLYRVHHMYEHVEIDLRG